MTQWLTDITSFRGTLPRRPFLARVIPLALLSIAAMVAVTRFWGTLMLPTGTGTLSYAWQLQAFVVLTFPLMWRRLADAGVHRWLRIGVPGALFLIPPALWFHAASRSRGFEITENLLETAAEQPDQTPLALAPMTATIDMMAMIGAGVFVALLWLSAGLALTLILTMLLLLPTAPPSTQPSADNERGSV